MVDAVEKVRGIPRTRNNRQWWSVCLERALYNPLSTSAVKMPTDFAIAPVGFALPTLWRAPPFVVVAVDGLGGIALAHGMSSDGATLHGVVR